MVVLSAPFSQVSGAPVAVPGRRSQSVTDGSGLSALASDAQAVSAQASHAPANRVPRHSSHGSRHATVAPDDDRDQETGELGQRSASRRLPGGTFMAGVERRSWSASRLHTSGNDGRRRGFVGAASASRLYRSGYSGRSRGSPSLGSSSFLRMFSLYRLTMCGAGNNTS